MYEWLWGDRFYDNLIGFCNLAFYLLAPGQQPTTSDVDITCWWKNQELIKLTQTTTSTMDYSCGVTAYGKTPTFFHYQ